MRGVLDEAPFNLGLAAFDELSRSLPVTLKRLAPRHRFILFLIGGLDGSPWKGVIHLAVLHVAFRLAETHDVIPDPERAIVKTGRLSDKDAARSLRQARLQLWGVRTPHN